MLSDKPELSPEENADIKENFVQRIESIVRRVKGKNVLDVKKAEDCDDYRVLSTALQFCILDPKLLMDRLSESQRKRFASAIRSLPFMAVDTKDTDNNATVSIINDSDLDSKIFYSIINARLSIADLNWEALSSV